MNRKGYSFFNSKIINKQGFSLLEIIITVPLALLILTIVYSTITTTLTNNKLVETELENHIEHTNIIQSITTDIETGGKFEQISETSFKIGDTLYVFGEIVIRITPKREYIIATSRYEYNITKKEEFNILNITKDKFNTTFKLEFIHTTGSDT